MKKFIKDNKFIIGLFIVTFLVRLIYVLSVNTPVVSDFKTMYDASKELLNGTRLYKTTNYFTFWGYQMGHTFYQYILLSIFNSITFLKIVNAIVSSFTVVFIYLLCSKYTSKKSSKIVSIIYMLFPFPLYMNSVLSNQQLPLLLILISIYLLVNINYDNKYIKKSIIIGILLGLSNILRSEGIVIITSIFIFSLFLIKKENIRHVICSFLLITVMYLSVFNAASFAFKKSGLTVNGLKNENTYWKFVSGFNYETNGMYSENDAALYSNNPDAAKKEFINRAKKINKVPMLFIKKSKILWYNSDLNWPIGHINDTLFYKLSNIVNQLIIIIFLILPIFSVKELLKFNKLQYLSTIILFVYFGVYLLIEVMPRYAYNLQPFLVILSAYGLDNILKHFKKKE